MKIIEQYSPPSADALARLKIDLGYTSQQMAELVGLAQGGQWRDTPAAPRRALWGCICISIWPHSWFYLKQS